ncbi:MAG: hypothetical protein QOI62_278 [Solirubrobacteraceae bacterium]|jgi:hypothetical protein|nr:hypothetical protein [Solirubrobacteraceae bacterium]
MNAFQGLEPSRGKGDFAPDPPGLDLFARIEGLCGEEAALLAIPAHRRDGAQHDRLHAIAAELDRAFEKLRERAERLARHGREEPSST